MTARRFSPFSLFSSFGLRCRRLAPARRWFRQLVAKPAGETTQHCHTIKPEPIPPTGISPVPRPRPFARRSAATTSTFRLRPPVHYRLGLVVVSASSTSPVDINAPFVSHTNGEFLSLFVRFFPSGLVGSASGGPAPSSCAGNLNAKDGRRRHGRCLFARGGRPSPRAIRRYGGAKKIALTVYIGLIPSSSPSPSCWVRGPGAGGSAGGCVRVVASCAVP